MSADGIEPDDLPDGLVIAGADAAVTHVNRVAERILGIERALLLGRDVRKALPWQDSTGRRWWDCTDPWRGLAIRTGHRERLLQLPGGTEVLVTARYDRPAPGAPVNRVVLSLRDTVARQRTEVDHASLISTVAHELRSPLTSVKGFTATLLRRWDRFTDEQKQLMLATVEADADRVVRLISELLDISRIDAGRLEIRRQPLDLVTIVRAHLQRVAVSAELDVAAGDVDRVPPQLDLVVKGPLPEVWADPDRIDQVLSNLLENAVRHGEPPVTVTLDGIIGQQGEALLLIVDDAGEGIRAEHLPMVFSRFWRGARRGGTGLGLYVVRGLIEAHDGSIEVGPSPFGGARFAVTLPAGAPPGLD